MHFFATLMVCLGAHFSAIWIVVANSWMQTPAGFRMVEHGLGTRAEITDFWAMVFNPSTVDRLTHTVLGAWQAGAFLVVSVSAYYLLKGKFEDFARRSLQSGPGARARGVGRLARHRPRRRGGRRRNQPAKLAAFEAHFPAVRARRPVRVRLGRRSEASVSTGVAVPGMLSWMLHGDANAPVTGLLAFAPEDRPPVQLGVPVVPPDGRHRHGPDRALASRGPSAPCGAARRRRAWLLWLLVVSVLGPQIANQVGWMTAEVGRQPWIVYGLMRTSEGVSRSVSAGAVVFSLILFTLIYTLLFALFLFLLDSKIKHGPVADDLTASPKRA